jgi:NAD(P)-dependent dehydrogenase (short-subunit alcohol dehydrogenase family)
MTTELAVVVGGTKGLGRVVTERFKARGMAVTVISRSVPSEETCGVRHVAADLETLTDAAAIVHESLGSFSSLRYLIFCQRYRGVGDSWTGELQVGVTATRTLIEAFMPHFAKSGDRAIGVVSSVYAEFIGGSQPVGYHVAKAGLNQLVRYYANALGKQSIRVNAVMPLTYLKEENKSFYLSNEALMALYGRFVPLGRPGHASDSADALDFLCSEKASFITGQCLYVDGGVSVMWPEGVARDIGGI